MIRGNRMLNGVRDVFDQVGIPSGGYHAQICNLFNHGEGLRGDMFSGGRVLAEGREKRHQYNASTYGMDDARRTLTEALYTQYQRMVMQQQRLKVLNAALLAAQEAQALHRRAQQEGLESQIDTLNAERTLYTIQRSLVSTQFDVLITQIALERLSGRISDDLLVYLDSLLIEETALLE